MRSAARTSSSCASDSTAQPVSASMRSRWRRGPPETVMPRPAGETRPPHLWL
ncbi:MAG: hypothetical protein LC795_09285 [Acidobacteria bacterium]|nr:hypothetical protein [Acidobacteriota bacterium]